MSVRIAVYGALGLLLICAVIWWMFGERQARIRTSEFTRLWLPYGNTIWFTAHRVTHATQDVSDVNGARVFADWESWPSELQDEVKSLGLRVCQTETMENCTLTSFGHPNLPDARWYYVVPALASGETGWFIVMASSPRVRVYVRSPGSGDTPVVDRRESGIPDRRVIRELIQGEGKD